MRKLSRSSVTARVQARELAVQRNIVRSFFHGPTVIAWSALCFSPVFAQSLTPEQTIQEGLHRPEGFSSRDLSLYLTLTQSF